jgi:hypothetical protein
VQKHDVLSMKKIKSSRHKYDRYENGGNYDDGTGEGHELRRMGMHRRERDGNSYRGGGWEEETTNTDGWEEEMTNKEQSVDDMAILNKHETAKWSQHSNNQSIRQSQQQNVAALEHDDQKAVLLQPPPDPPSLTERHVDKLVDLNPPLVVDDTIPAKYKVFADVKTPYAAGRDTPYLWHVPRSGGVIVKTLMSHCLKMTLAAEVGELEGHDSDEVRKKSFRLSVLVDLFCCCAHNCDSCDNVFWHSKELKVVNLFEHNYTNVNVATAEGIARAQSLGLVPSHMADVIVSAQVDKIPSLFTSNERARAFVLLRNPVDRAASMFYFIKSMGNERMKNMTLVDYAKSDMIENNWLGEFQLLLY